MNKRQRSKARRSHKMRREQDRAALREQKARIVADLRARGLTHDPRFMLSALSVSYALSQPGTPTVMQLDGGDAIRIHGGCRVNVPRQRRTVPQ